MQNAVGPVLRSFDEAKAKEFYVASFDFKRNFEHRLKPGLKQQMKVSGETASSTLPEHCGDASLSAAMRAVRIEVNGMDVFQQELPAQNYGYASRP